MSARRRTAFAVTGRPAPTKAATARARVSNGHSRAASTTAGPGFTAVLCPPWESGPGRRDHQTSPIGVDVGCVAPRRGPYRRLDSTPERLASLPRSAGAALKLARTCSYVSAAFVVPAARGGGGSRSLWFDPSDQEKWGCTASWAAGVGETYRRRPMIVPVVLAV
jgi:hypothetical protein